jgi:DNA-binding LytR/AlgR family response regulator
MQNICILVVEDDPIIAADLKDRLEELDYLVLGPVAAGEEALERVKRGPEPDMILMDIQLEGNWDGIETAAHIQAYKSLPLIFLTSNSDEATFTRAKTVKPQAFLSKPFRSRDLVHAIELAVRQSTVQAAAPPEALDDTFILKDRLFIKVKDRMLRVFFQDILWVQADDYYCKIKTAQREFLVTKTLKKFGEELLPRPEFVRVHRSYIVNLLHIEEIGELCLHMGGHQVPLAKEAREELMLKLRRG